jgi:hypothetical protein
MPIPRISQYQHGSSLNPDSQDRSLELESELTEYSSSFFDDYDEEFEDDDSDIEEETSDDEFDDSTLWEIGNLLNSSDVPSRDSMLPPPRIIEDYDDEDSEEETEPMETPNRAPVVRFMPIQPLMPKSPIAAASEPESIAAPTAKPLWMAANQSERAVIRAGLAQPAAQVWNTYVPASTDIVRAKPRENVSVPVIETNDLWMSKEESTVTPESSSLWGVIKPVSPVAAPLWSAGSISKNTAVKSWLTQDADVTPLVKQIAGRTVSKPRQGSIMVPVIKSRDLWSTAISSALVHGAEKKSVGMWNNKDVEIADSTKSTPQLWTARQTALVIQAAGLFASNIHRTDYRTTSAAPAALNTARKPRISAVSLPSLQTQNLWTSNAERFFERHWISESSIRPTSPSIYSGSNSPTSSGRSSPNSDDGDSIASASTKASSVWSPMSALTTLAKGTQWWDGKRGIASPDPESDKLVSKIPIKQKSVKPTLPSVRESRVLASRDMWEKMAPTVDEAPKRSWRSSKVVALPAAVAFVAASPKKVTKTQLRATQSQWESALAAAIAKGTPKVQRPKATAGDWMNALKDAMPIERAVVSVSASSAVQPAQMWTSDISHAATEADASSDALMWSASLLKKAPLVPDLFHAVRPVSKKSAPKSTSVALPTLNSTTFWGPTTSATSAAKHWLHSTTRPRASTWTASEPSIGQIGNSVASSPKMWSPSSDPFAVAQATSFTSIPTAAPRKKSSSAISAKPLLSIESTAFWAPSTSVSTLPTHWLHSTAAKRARAATTAAVMTWSPSQSRANPATTKVEGMWTPSAVSNIETEELLFKSYTLAAAPRKATPKAASIEGLPVLNSVSLWTPSMSLAATEDVKNWLQATAQPTVERIAAPAVRTSTRGRAATWTPSALNTVSETTEGALWVPNPSTAATEPMFGDVHVAPWERKARRSEETVQKVESEMWRYSMRDFETKKERNWMIERRASRVQFRY